MTTRTDGLRRRYGGVTVPAAWVAAAVAVTTSTLVLVDKGGRPWGELAPTMLEDEGDFGAYIFFGALISLFLVIATRLWRREPTNSLARLAAIFAIAGCAAITTDMWSSWMVASRGATDAALGLRLMGSPLLGIGWSALVMLLLRFPTGRRLSPRWRVVEVASMAGAALLVLAVFAPDNSDIEPFTSPFADGPASDIATIGYLGWTFLSLGVPFAVISILIRAVRARGDERQQLKWVGFGLLFGWGGAFVITVLTGQPSADGGGGGILAGSDLAVTLGDAVFPFLIFAMPMTMVVAMYRYRLWDIDRIIRRTAAYAVVLGVLAGIYTGGVIATSSLTHSLTGGTAGDVGVALSTLVAAGLFRPIQRRVKELVDRRFNRRRNTSLQRITAYHASLRNEFDLESIAGRLEQLAAEVLEPSTVSLWLTTGRTPERARGTGRQ